MKTARERWEILNLIRQEKFNSSLPLAMRENEVDMWIHCMREGNPDSLAIDLGGDTGYFVFFDSGKERIERAVFGGDKYHLMELDCYDIFGKEEELRDYIQKKDPNVIAINTSEWLAVADGISYSEYNKLTKSLGEKFSLRLLSAENLITDFRTRRIPREIELYKEICEFTRQLMERALSNEVITPGQTSREDVGWWMEDQLTSRGMKATFSRTMPYITHSDTSERSDCWKRDYIIQQGDLVVYDFGIDFMNYGTDIKRTAYVLKEGEMKVPSGIQNGWIQALKAREVIKEQVKVGQTAGEALEKIGNSVQQAGFKYLPIAINPMEKAPTTIEAPKNPEDRNKTEVSIDFHCVGNSGNSQVASGPAIAGFRQDKAHLVIKSYHIFAFEFVAYTPNPDWNYRKVRISIEDDAIVTENGVEWLCPPNERILLISVQKRS